MIQNITHFKSRGLIPRAIPGLLQHCSPSMVTGFSSTEHITAKFQSLGGQVPAVARTTWQCSRGLGLAVVARLCRILMETVS